MFFGFNTLHVIFAWLGILLILIVSYTFAYRRYKKALVIHDPKLKQVLDSTEEELANTPVYDDGVEDSFASLFVFITPRAIWPLPIWLDERNRELKSAATTHAILVYITWAWIALAAITFWLTEHKLI